MSLDANLINPHGGILINREVFGAQREALSRNLEHAPSVTLNSRSISDLELIANGAYSPLEGFMTEADYVSVRDHRRLANGSVWTIPVTLPVSEEQTAGLRTGTTIALRSRTGSVLAALELEDIYKYDKLLEAERVYLTNDDSHPGIRVLKSQGDFLLGGRVALIAHSSKTEFAPYRFSPADARAEFQEREWKTVVAFQTRNPVHRAHEYIQKCALETVDGLFLHPLVGDTKADDIPADIRVRAYEVILDKYYPSDRTLLGVMPAAMRYAGPREAIFHAIIRKNYGCSHFIVGRDHAGVGKFYGTYDAQKIFSEFRGGELGIVPMFFDHTFFCRRCDGMASIKTCPHDQTHHVALSGTHVREMLERGELPPVEFTRPEVAEVLMSSFRQAAQAA